MSKRIWLILFINAMAYFTVCADDTLNKIDNIRVLISIKNHDTINVDYYLLLAETYRHENPENTIEYANKALALSKKHCFNRGVQEAYIQLFNGHFYVTGSSDTLLFYLKKLEKARVQGKVSFEPYFTTIKKSTVQLYTSIKDFAKYTQLSQDDKVEKTEVNLNKFFKTFEEPLNAIVWEYNGKLLVEDMPVVTTNKTMLYIILKNLIENGLKFNQSDIPTVKISYTSTDTHHQLIVSDNGIGIEEQYFDKVFEMFKRLHPRCTYNGSGIGLAIVKLVADKLNGHISLESELEKGTSFTLSLSKD